MVVEALDDRVRDLAPERLAGLGGEREAELGAVFPSLAARARAAVLSTPEERHRFHMAIRVLLEELAIDAPVLLALDDLQWADDASVELVAHLLRRPPRAPVTIVLAYRRRYLGSLLSDCLDDAAKDERAEVLELRPLTVEEIDELLVAVGNRRARVLVCRESGGNPFYAHELARAIKAGGGLGLDALAAIVGGGVPKSVLASLERELARLSPDAGLLVRGAALAGEPFELDLAAAIAELNDDAALLAIDQLIVAEIARRAQMPGRYVFRHPIVRHAVYASCAESWRLSGHARAASALAARGLPPAVIAPHVERSARTGDSEAVRGSVRRGGVRRWPCARHGGLLVGGGAAAARRPRVTEWVASAGVDLALGCFGR
jgi:predicted ATPase